MILINLLKKEAALNSEICKFNFKLMFINIIKYNIIYGQRIELMYMNIMASIALVTIFLFPDSIVVYIRINMFPTIFEDRLLNRFTLNNDSSFNSA